LIEQLPKVFFEIHDDLPREGPGDDESTRKAYMMLRDLPENPRILDVGCGPGMQTRWLAHLSNVTIEAVDGYEPYLEQLRRNAEAEGVSEKINAVKGDMFGLKYKNGSFDIIWSEGAIYITGFEKGLREWKRLLTPRGYLVISEVSWLKPDPPDDLKKFWTDNYPAITTIQQNLETATKTGYDVIGYFVLPESSWWDNYYTPLLEKLPAVRAAHRNEAEALTFIGLEELEIDMFRRCSDYYGYVFYILQAKA
jgi:ubiquinone/menaquinone biosynthesis C-methylase UbiE